MGLDVTGRYRYPPPAPHWLAQRVEDVIEPNLPIVDAHHHLWEEGGQTYLLDELAGDLASGHLITATVFTQAHYGYRTSGPAHLAPVGETEKVAQLSREARETGCATRVAEGIVAFADLTLGERLEEVLDAHEQQAGGALRGIRHSVSRDEHFPDGIVLRPAPAGMLADPCYRAGLRRVAERNLVYDAMLYHPQLPELVEMAHELPELSIVLDHIGCILGIGVYEGREDELFARWRADMRELAQCANVKVKVGGFGMILCGARWHEEPMPPSSADLAAAWRRYVETCIELFGADRCMFESNFPVDKAMYSYRTLWNAFKRLTQDCSVDERRNLFARTAQRTYALDTILSERQAPEAIRD